MHLSHVLDRIGAAVVLVRTLARAGVVRPHAPWRLAKVGRTVVQWGTGPAGGFQSLYHRWPDRACLVDERGTLTNREVHERSNALAHALAELGVAAGDSVAVMCRNHRYFVDASVGAAKLGADVLYLNTAFAGPQLVDVLERERPVVVVYDDEFTGLLAGADVTQGVLAWADAVDGSADRPSVDALIEGMVRRGRTEDLAPPARHGRVVILTSGTTGTPKAAPRHDPGLDAAVAILERIPLRSGMRVHVAAPLFHTWGFAHLALGMLLGTTMVLRRRFDAEDLLRTVQEERCEAVVVIPVMLQRIMALEAAVRDRYDLSHVRVVTSSGSALPGDLAARWMDQYGEHLYSTYGSTEVAYGSISTPHDLRAAPGTAGRAPVGTVVRILGDDGRPVPDGTTGRIFVGNSMLFEGYTGGGSKEVVDGLMATGDVGRIDADGRLYVEGRDDEMIVSGGENVFPQEVEDCLARHEGVVEAAAIGVADDDFGKRLRAFVVVTGESTAAPSEDELKAWVKDNLARYKVPREIVLVEELPRNATGKVLKRDLAGE